MFHHTSTLQIRLVIKLNSRKRCRNWCWCIINSAVIYWSISLHSLSARSGANRSWLMLFHPLKLPVPPHHCRLQHYSGSPGHFEENIFGKRFVQQQTFLPRTFATPTKIISLSGVLSGVKLCEGSCSDCNKYSIPETLLHIYTRSVLSVLEFFSLPSFHCFRNES